MMNPWFQSCGVSRSWTTDSTRSSPTSSPAAMVRRTNAPILVWLCTFQRKMSPTLMCTMSRSAASSWLCVPLPLPCTPMITYLRMSTAWHTRYRHFRLGRPVISRAQAELALAGPPRRGAEQRAQLRPVIAQPPRVDEPGQVVPPALAEHDAVQHQPGLFQGDVELAQPVPGQVDRQHDHSLPRSVQVIEPGWLGWHLLMVVSFWGMLWLGDWQLHRALAGNGLSWAYTFEWPLFAGFAVVFWAKTIKDEFR